MLFVTTHIQQYQQTEPRTYKKDDIALTLQFATGLSPPSKTTIRFIFLKHNSDQVIFLLKILNAYQVNIFIRCLKPAIVRSQFTCLAKSTITFTHLSSVLTKQLYAFPEYSLIYYLHAFEHASYFSSLNSLPNPD